MYADGVAILSDAGHRLLDYQWKCVPEDALAPDVAVEEVSP